MAAEVSSLVRVINGYRDDLTVGNDHHHTVGGNSTSLITRDLLGGGGGSGGGGVYGSSSSIRNESQELDLDMEVPSGWEKRLDLKSGKVYLQRSNCTASMSSSSSDHQRSKANQTVGRFQDLNFPPSPSSKVTLNLFDEGSLDLKLVSSSPASSSSPSSSAVYQSVCTLEKVKSALERAEKEPGKKRPTAAYWKSSSPPSSTSSSFSFREPQEEEDCRGKLLLSPVAAGCPGCLSYVLIMKSNPKCPRCNTIVPLPMSKKPRIDLNMSI